MHPKDHWEQVYTTRLAEKLGWYKPRLDTSLAWIEELGLDRSSPLIDVGGGASTLVDDLVDAGYESITILDISENALAASKKRLGRQSELIMWLPGDVTTYSMPKHRFELWHDRAVLHFFVDPALQRAYRDNLIAALRPGGHAVIAAFAPEAPAKCSGLPVQRYEQHQLAGLLGDEFELRRSHREMHVTPGGVEQMYLYTLFRRKGAPSEAQ